MVWRNPSWTPEKRTWFMATIEAFCSKPAEANFSTIYNRFDLELCIEVAPEDEAKFTEDVVEALTRLVSKATGVSHPVVYLDGKPSARVAELLSYADHHL